MERVMGFISANYASNELGTLTDQRTIASLPYGGRYRLIDFPLSNMINSGITTVGVVMPYKYRSIIDHVGAGKEWGLDRKKGGLYILPGSVFGINNSGHRFLLRDMRRNMAFLRRSRKDYLIGAGTSCIYNMDYEQFLKKHIESGAGMTLLVKKMDKDEPHQACVKTEYGLVTGMTSGVKAGDLAFMDCFIINRDLLMNILDWYQAVDYMDLFGALADDFDKIRIHTYELDEYVQCVHSTEEYFKGSMELLSYHIRKQLFLEERPVITKIQDTVPSRYADGCQVENSLIPAGCNIKGKVRNSILFRGVVVEKGAEVENSIILQNCVIGRNAKIGNAIIDRFNVIGEGTILKGTEKDILIKDKADN